MKTLLFSFAFFLTVIVATLATPDAKYIQAMEGTLTQMHNAKTLTDIQQVANRFEMIGNANPTEWLPAYYAALCYANLSFMEKDSDKRDQYVAKAEKLLEGITAENDELFVMRAFVAQANMAVDGQNRWQKQGALFQANLQKAEKLNPENPRIDYLRGNSLYYTPEAFGGGVKAACPLLQKAKTKFDAFKAASSIAPDWGKEHLAQLMQKCG